MVRSETHLWETPYDLDPHARITSCITRDYALGIVIASLGNDRLVLFPGCFGWSNSHNFVSVKP
jgi:hypothetical protein